jgi:hypothetical protein
MIAAAPRIRPRGLQILVFCLALCVTPLGLPGQVIRSLGEAAWSAAAAVLAGALIGAWAAAWAVSRLDGGGGLIGGVRRRLGAVVAHLWGWPLGLTLAAGMPLNLGVFAQVATTRDLPALPQAYSALLVGGPAVLASAYGVEAVVRVAEVMAPFLTLGLVIVFGSAFANVRVDVLTFAPPAASPATIVLLLACLGMARGFLAVLVIAPRTRPRPRTPALVAAATAAAMLVGLSIELPLLAFSPAFAAQLQFPFVTLSGTVVWQWLPAQKVEFYLLLVWQALAFVVAAAYPVLAAEVLSPLAGLGRRPLAVGVAVLGALASAVWVAPVRRELYALIWNLAVVAVGVVAPVALATIARRREVGGALRQGAA